MAGMRLTIQHNGNLFEPPIESGVKIEWERTGSSGKLTFTTIKIPNSDMTFSEGDPVCFYYDDKSIFMGYVFTKKRDRENHIDVTCYDQLRYLKNKYSYVFENKTATQIITSLCQDFNLYLGGMENTKYVIPSIAEENKSAFDIILNIIEETLLNTGNMFVLYDDFGKLMLKNVTNMISDTLIFENSAENFDYSSSIDDETYNNVVLYYKDNNNKMQIYTASSKDKIAEWGTLRYFEEVKNPTIGQNKANALLKLYCKKTRELKITGAFGDSGVRGGTLIPVILDLGDISVKNYMLVEKVTHHYEKDHYTMDLTLQGAWEDNKLDITSNSYSIYNPFGSSSSNASGVSSGGGYGGYSSGSNTQRTPRTYMLNINFQRNAYVGNIYVTYYDHNNKQVTVSGKKTSFSLACREGTSAVVMITPLGSSNGRGDHGFVIDSMTGNWKKNTSFYTAKMTTNATINMRWVR